jgi:hypothetical protein
MGRNLGVTQKYVKYKLMLSLATGGHDPIAHWLISECLVVGDAKRYIAVRRHVIGEQYAAQIAALYEDGSR